ncbi:MAG: hypothetical protein ACREB8_14235 [Pseudolabrys sp.]
MRRLKLAIAVLLVCAVAPALAQDVQNTPPVEPQAAPSAPIVQQPPSIPDAQTAPSASDDSSTSRTVSSPNGASVSSTTKGSSATATVRIGPQTRYTFNPANNGFLRLDNQTGHIAFCSAHSVGWACEAVPEDRAALEKEIARLQDEVANLKQEVAALREPPPPRPPAELAPQTPDKSEDTAKLHDDLARARVAFDNAWRRLVEMIVNFQKDMMPKG